MVDTEPLNLSALTAATLNDADIVYIGDTTGPSGKKLTIAELRIAMQPSGAWVPLSVQTPSAAASVDFTSLDQSLYYKYRIEFSGVFSSVLGDVMNGQISESTVFQVAGTDYEYARNGEAATPSNVSTGSLAHEGIPINHLGGATLARGMEGTIYLSGLASGEHALVRNQVSEKDQADLFRVYSAGGQYSAGTAVADGFRLIMLTTGGATSGNITGTFVLSGLKV